MERLLEGSGWNLLSYCMRRVEWLWWCGERWLYEWVMEATKCRFCNIPTLPFKKHSWEFSLKTQAKMWADQLSLNYANCYLKIDGKLDNSFKFFYEICKLKYQPNSIVYSKSSPTNNPKQKHSLHIQNGNIYLNHQC